jgi:hypothetical protein
MKLHTSLLAFVSLALLASSPVRAGVAAYDTFASFNAAVAGLITYGFNGITVPEPGCIGCALGPQTVGGITFNSTGFPFVLAADPTRYGGGVQVFSGQSSTVDPSNVIVTTPGIYAIGFNFGAYITTPGTPVTIALNTGDVFTRILPPNAGLDTVFLGFTSTAPLTSIIFTTIGNVANPPPVAYSLDIVNFTTISPVPEPAEWAMMALGLGAIAFLRKRGKQGKGVGYATFQGAVA